MSANTSPIRHALLLAFGLAIANLPTAQAQVWDGGGANDNWTTANNWNPNAVPANNGTAIIGFRGSVRLTPLVNTPQSIQALAFLSPAGSFDVTNGGLHNFLDIGSGGITNNDNSLQTVTCPIRLTASQTWDANSGDLAINAADGGGFALTIDGSFNTTISRVTGTCAAFTKTGSGTLTLTGNSSFVGPIIIDAGTLAIDADARLGNAANDVTINGGALAMTSDLTTSRAITLTAAGAAINGTTHQLALENGALTVNGGTATTQSGFIGFNAGTTGSADVDGSASSWTMTGSFGVGYQGNGTLSVLAGGSVQSDIAHVGSVAGSIGSATVSGAGSTWTNAGFLGIGYSGTGTLNIDAGGSVSTDSSFVGTDPSAVGVVNVTGPTSLWNVNGAPVIGEDGDGELTISDGASLTCSGAYVGRMPTGTGSATITGPDSMLICSSTIIVGSSGNGTMTIEAAGNVQNTSYAQIGGNTGSVGLVTVTGTGSTWENGAEIYVGFQGMGTLQILAGGTVTNTDASIAGGIGADGSAVVVGGGATWTNTGELTVGDGGEGALTIDAGGTVTSSLARIGMFNTGDGTATVTGGGATWTNDNLAVGYLGGTGELTVQQGGAVSSDNGSVGNSSGIGFATITGTGSSWTIPGAISVGFNATGWLMVQEGGSLSSFFVSLGFGSGASATATIVDSGSTWTIGNELQMSADGATSTLNLDGGTTTVGADITDGGSGVSTIVLEGGTLNMQSHKIGGATPIDVLDIRSGVLKNVSQINNGAGFTKTTGGTLILDGTNTFGGTTTIADGTLRLAKTQNLSGGANIAAGGRYMVEITGIGAGTGYPQLKLSGLATLAGTLDIVRPTGFEPSIGQSFVIMTHGSRTGTFSKVTGRMIGHGKMFDVVYNAGNVTLVVVPVVSTPLDSLLDFLGVPESLSGLP